MSTLKGVGQLLTALALVASWVLMLYWMIHSFAP
jgi:hypothetical protein